MLSSLNIPSYTNNPNKCVGVCTQYVCVISERLNQENGKTYGTDFLGTKLCRSQ